MHYVLERKSATTTIIYAMSKDTGVTQLHTSRNTNKSVSYCIFTKYISFIQTLLVLPLYRPTNKMYALYKNKTTTTTKNCTALIQHTLNRYKIISECIVTTTSTTSTSNCIYFNNKFNNYAANLPATLINVSMGKHDNTTQAVTGPDKRVSLLTVSTYTQHGTWSLAFTFTA